MGGVWRGPGRSEKEETQSLVPGICLLLAAPSPGGQCSPTGEVFCEVKRGGGSRLLDSLASLGGILSVLGLRLFSHQVTEKQKLQPGTAPRGVESWVILNRGDCPPALRTFSNAWRHCDYCLCGQVLASRR